ncbi:MAG: hypothetical protein AAF125_04520 [Chloroflexota bacterium]
MFFLIAKHPKVQYVIAIAIVFPAMLLVLLLAIKPLYQRYPLIQYAIAVAIFIPFGVNLVHNFQTHTMLLDVASEKSTLTHEFTNAFHEQHPHLGNPTVLHTHGSYDRCFGLWFSDGIWTNYSFEELIDERCSDSLYLESTTGYARTLEGNKYYTDPSLCWHIAFTGGIGEMDDAGPIVELRPGYYAITNARFVEPQTAYFHDFDHEFCGQGWHPPESTPDDSVGFAWMSQSEATVPVTLDATHDYNLTVNVLAFVDGDVMFSLRPVVNGETLNFEPGVNAGEFVTHIPKQLIAQNPNATDIQLVIDETLPAPDNARQLGIAFDWIRIDAVASENTDM